MTNSKQFVLLVAGAISYLCFQPTTGLAVLASYQIQSSSWIQVIPSSFNASGDILAGSRFLTTIGIKEQTSGSLRTQLSGLLTADVTGSTFAFGSSAIDALPNSGGPFLPVAASPGQEDNFGATTLSQFDGVDYPNGEAAIRDVGASLNGGTAVLGTAPTGLQFSLTAGIMNFRLDFGGTGSQSFVPSPVVTNTSGSIFSGNVNGTIQIPLHLEFPYAIADPNTIDSLIVIDAEIVANRVGASVAGDYNSNGKVDAADYAVWRNLNGTTDSRADGSGNGSVGIEDYNFWKARFGNASGAGAAVPEPSGFMFCVVLAFASVGMFVRVR